jgi:Raf kinase inhibitor-like YbhB/YbcL family protein
MTKRGIDMKLSSTDFDDGGQLEMRHGKEFDNVSPQLSWSDLPSGTASLALTVIDTHPVARGYVHWFVDDIPPADGEFAGGAGGDVPVGREVKPYIGPFPPAGTHEYVFTLYALDESTPALPRNSTVSDFLDSVDGHVLGTSKLTGSFTKQAS